MSGVSACQGRRAQLLLAVLRQPAAQEAANSLGITDHRFISRLEEDLRLHASIAEAPRSGRPAKYTDHVLEQACLYMMEGVEACWTKEDIVDGMVQADILPAGTSVRGFWERFSDYMRQRGTPVVYGCQLMTFALSLKHIQGRLSFCHRHKRTFTVLTMPTWWFVDELIVEQGGHPKCEWPAGSQHMQAASVHPTPSLLAAAGLQAQCLPHALYSQSEREGISGLVGAEVAGSCWQRQHAGGQWRPTPLPTHCCTTSDPTRAASY